MKRIGSGHFGTVSKGLWCCGEDAKEVAVKTVKTTTEQERIKLLQEAAIMGQFAHNNVIRLHGVVTVGEPVSVRYYLAKICRKISLPLFLSPALT